MSRLYFEAESHVATYNQFRPRPPQAMIEEIVRYAQQKISGPLRLAVDVGCGSGQSTEVFAPFFERVIGVDPSPSIVREAQKKCRFGNVSYSQGTAENIPVEDASTQLLFVCQSLHWFNTDKFYHEAERILAKDGVFAVSGYHLPVPVVEGSRPELESIVRKYYEDVLLDFTFPESRKVYLDNYKLPEFSLIPFVDGGQMSRHGDNGDDAFVTEVDGRIADLVGYLMSWSTYQNYVRKMGPELGKCILEQFEADFRALAGREIDSKSIFKIKYKYFLLLGRKA